MGARGTSTWFAMDCLIHISPEVLELSQRLGLDVDATVGKLARLWAWAKLARNESGDIGRMPDEELAGVMRWKKKPAALTEALVVSGVLERGAEGTLLLRGWYETNGKAAEKARKDRERKAGSSRATGTGTKTGTAPSSSSAQSRTWMREYD